MKPIYVYISVENEQEYVMEVTEEQYISIKNRMDSIPDEFEGCRLVKLDPIIPAKCRRKAVVLHEVVYKHILTVDDRRVIQTTSGEWRRQFEEYCERHNLELVFSI